MESIDRFLVLGGTRSGKSSYAEEISKHLGCFDYLATLDTSGDEAAAQRVALHRKRRADTFATFELTSPTALVDHILQAERPFLLDSLGNFVASSMAKTERSVGDLVVALRQCSVPWVIVSEEVGLSVHPETEVGRLFVDRLGNLNQAVAAVATDVCLVVAGIPLKLKMAPATRDWC